MDVLWRFILFDLCVCFLLLPSTAIWKVAGRSGSLGLEEGPAAGDEWDPETRCVRTVQSLRRLGDLVTASPPRVFLACFETSFEDWSWPGMFRRDELRRAGTCGVDVGRGLKVIMQGGIVPNGQGIRRRCPTGRSSARNFGRGLVRTVQSFPD